MMIEYMIRLKFLAGVEAFLRDCKSHQLSPFTMEY
jgi:hypothetical protein